MTDIYYFQIHKGVTQSQNAAQEEFLAYVRKFDQTLLIGDAALKQFTEHLKQYTTLVKEQFPRVSKFSPRVMVTSYSSECKYIFGDNFIASAQKVKRVYPDIQLGINEPIILDFSVQ